ncbi:MAG: hypothetical protein L0215_01235 [Gemmataceae bacterium]|nr:hypothetical protein [Gemmataceae bacterium]
MSVFTRRWFPGLLLALLMALFMGCGQEPAPPGTAVVQTNRPVSTEPGQIQLSNPKVTLAEPNMVQFEVNYRFTKGKPEKYYLCEISFPGTQNHAVKPMDSRELKPEGVIKDGIVLFKPPVKTFEIRVSEADSPQNGYKIISNVIGGPVE